jgi:hypothetical protein
VPCFALGGRYQREFKERAVQYARQYHLGHVILDFMAHSCDVPGHGHPVGPESRIAIDAGLADVLDALRAVNPAMVLEPMVCGYPPSPWWLMPTQALETFDITVLTPGEFRNMAVMAIGRGRWFLSTYFEPTRMKPEDWDFVAGLVRWARQNQELLVNAWQIGGRPEDREAYGYMFRNPTTDVYCVRNPWIEERSIELPASAIATEAREVRIIYPRRETVGRIGPGEPSRTRYYWDGVLRMLPPRPRASNERNGTGNRRCVSHAATRSPGVVADAAAPAAAGSGLTLRRDFPWERGRPRPQHSECGRGRPRSREIRLSRGTSRYIRRSPRSPRW